MPSTFISPKDFVYGLAKKAGLKTRRTTDIIQIMRPRSAEMGAGPLAAMTFSCRRWSDASYLFNVRSGAIDPLIEGVLEGYAKHQVASFDIKPKGPLWLALTVVTHRQQAENALYDEAAKSELERSILDWFGRQSEFSTSDIEAGLQSQLQSDRRLKSFSEKFEDLEAMCRRVIVARDMFGWALPDNAELEDRLATLRGETSRERFKVFVAWWASHRRAYS